LRETVLELVSSFKSDFEKDLGALILYTLEMWLLTDF